jgi:hypothetical protein
VAVVAQEVIIQWLVLAEQGTLEVILPLKELMVVQHHQH